MAHGVYEIWYRSARNYWGVIYLGERDIGPRCSSKRLLSHSWTLYHRRWRLINDLTTSWWTMWNLFEGVYHVSIPTAQTDNTALIYGRRPFFVAGKFVAAIRCSANNNRGRQIYDIFSFPMRPYGRRVHKLFIICKSLLQVIMLQQYIN